MAPIQGSRQSARSRSGSARLRNGSAHLVRPGTSIGDTGNRVNVAGPASDARMKTSTRATTAIRDAAPTVQPSFRPALSAFDPNRLEQDHHKPGKSDPGP